MTSDEVKALDVGRPLSPRDRAGRLGMMLDGEFNTGTITLTRGRHSLVLTSREQVEDFLDMWEAREGVHGA